MCMHVLADMTELPREVLQKAVAYLQREGEIRKVDPSRIDREAVFELVDQSLVIVTSSDRLPGLFGLEESRARDRVVMLKRMRSRLITEWHPILDQVIGDYEHGLRVMEVLREGEDEDDPQGLKFEVKGYDYG